MDEVAVVRAVLASMGVEYEPKVATLLAEYLRRNVDELLVESLDYAKYAGRKHVDLADARLAALSRDASDGYNNFSPIPQRDKMLQVALMVNRQPIDNIPPDYMLQLPPAAEAEGDAVLGANYTATTAGGLATGGGGAGAGAGGAQPMDVGAGEGEDDDEGAEAPPRTARRGEKNLRLMMASGGGGGGDGGDSS